MAVGRRYEPPVRENSLEARTISNTPKLTARETDKTPRRTDSGDRRGYDEAPTRQRAAFAVLHLSFLNYSQERNRRREPIHGFQRFVGAAKHEIRPVLSHIHQDSTHGGSPE